MRLSGNTLLSYLLISICSEKQNHQQWYTLRIYYDDLTTHLWELVKALADSFLCLSAEPEVKGQAEGKQRRTWPGEEKVHLESVPHWHTLWFLPDFKSAASPTHVGGALRCRLAFTPGQDLEQGKKENQGKWSAGQAAAPPPPPRQGTESGSAMGPELHPPSKCHSGCCFTVTFQIFQIFCYSSKQHSYTIVSFV